MAMLRMWLSHRFSRSCRFVHSKLDLGASPQAHDKGDLVSFFHACLFVALLPAGMVFIHFAKAGEPLLG